MHTFSKWKLNGINRTRNFIKPPRKLLDEIRCFCRRENQGPRVFVRRINAGGSCRFATIKIATGGRAGAGASVLAAIVANAKRAANRVFAKWQLFQNEACSAGKFNFIIFHTWNNFFNALFYRRMLSHVGYAPVHFFNSAAICRGLPTWIITPFTTFHLSVRFWHWFLPFEPVVTCIHMKKKYGFLSYLSFQFFILSDIIFLAFLYNGCHAAIFLSISCRFGSS